MKTISTILVTALLFSACSDKNGKSDAYGNFETVEVLVSSEVQGKLVQFNVDEGKTFKAGEMVGLIDTIQLTLKRDQLVVQRKASATKIENIRSQIDVQEEQKQTLLVDKNRIVNMLKDNAVPTKQLDDVNGKIKVIDSQIASIKTQNAAVTNEIASIDKQIDQIRDQLNRCRIINPINGTVLEKYVEPSEIAAPGKALYKVADMDKMILRVYVSGSQLSSVKLNQKVKVFIDKNKDEKETLEGEVTWVSPQAEFTPKIIQTKEERVNLVYAVKVSVKNDGRLKIGMPGEVKFN
ncbi:MAG: HlyD family efflux transporter periplasmic adaptor subunit [Bacteroidota bacterium]|nr:HlyD family efflux transporter periplasmic adaptor subunit [Bacteroidota bacterium]